MTGLLYCRCGERMYPKVSKRKTADGSPVYTYVCKLKERSQRSLCNSKNANGNLLDLAILEQLKQLQEDQDTLISQLEQSRKFYTGNRMDYEQRLDSLRNEKRDLEKKMDALVDSLADITEPAARSQVSRRIEALSSQCNDLGKRIQELEGLTSQHALSDLEFDLLRQLLAVFREGVPEMSLEQKRAAIRTVVRKVIWDGFNAHVVLFGVPDDEIEYPPLSSGGSAQDDTDDETNELLPYSDVEYEEDLPNSVVSTDSAKTHWGGGSK